MGAGGFGRVWRARDQGLNVDVAIKEVYVPSGSTSEETVERVERAAWEARHAAQLRDHPNIVTVHDVVVERGVPWTVMQYVVGRSLADEIRLNGAVSRELGEKVALAMLAALEACRDADIVHRDVKPANILLAEDGTVMLTDFGIAKQFGQSPMTAQDMVIGSLEYMAPERARGHAATPASDLFSLGVTLYHAVEGVSPFDRGSGMASLSAVLLDTLPKPSKADGRLAAVIESFTEKAPGDRMSAYRAAAVLRGQGEAEKPTPPMPKPTPTPPKPVVKAPRPATARVPSKPEAKTGSDGWELFKGLAGLAVVVGLIFNQPIWNYVHDHFLDTAPYSIENIRQGQCFWDTKAPNPMECDGELPADATLWQVLRRFDDPAATCSPSTVPGWPASTGWDGYHWQVRPADSSFTLCAEKKGV
ncbi:hypothetical protein ASE09_21460 [Streptomyces sp. Root66D1]|nr:hypothetical protein ASD33_16940 [Streptomyces sp. Root1304]KRA79048.1 hypothetical protein ASE09_21460 [Streptomyces sp. Root66D1]